MAALQVSKGAVCAHCRYVVSAPLTAPYGPNRALSRRCRHELLQGGTLVLPKAQAELGPAPEHVIGGLRPLLRHQIVHLGRGQIGAEPDAEILRPLCGLQHLIDPRAVGAGKPLRMLLAEKRPSMLRALDERRPAVIGKIATRQG